MLFPHTFAKNSSLSAAFSRVLLFFLLLVERVCLDGSGLRIKNQFWLGESSVHDKLLKYLRPQHYPSSTTCYARHYDVVELIAVLFSLYSCLTISQTLHIEHTSCTKPLIDFLIKLRVKFDTLKNQRGNRDSFYRFRSLCESFAVEKWGKCFYLKLVF